MTLNVYTNGNWEEIHGHPPTEGTNRRKKGACATAPELVSTITWYGPFMVLSP